tara:strand:+ start:157 stop:384 length:228 start_codon:yes stop_codon:yes gene_type:complete
MLRIIITSLLMMNAIFWGIYPPSEDSPHSLIFKFIGLDTQPNKYIHLLIGTIFYIVAVLISQQQSIMHITTNWWF